MKTLIPEGRYNLRVCEVTLKESQSGLQFLSLRLEIEDEGPYRYESLYYNIVSAPWRRKEILSAIFHEYEINNWGLEDVSLETLTILVFDKVFVADVVVSERIKDQYGYRATINVVNPVPKDYPVTQHVKPNSFVRSYGR